MEGDKPTKEMMLLATPEDNAPPDTPQEVKEWEQKYSQEDKTEEQNNLCINDCDEEKVTITSTETEVKKYKEFNANYLVLNFYWINFVSKLSFSISMIMTEVIGFMVLQSLFDLLNKKYETTKETLIFLFKDVGVKWITIITICQQLAIGFFSITNFSNILKETNEPFKFFI